MDLRKVFDQTVRDLKREVNKKVLKVPEIEQKVLDATSNESWGPHGTAMSEIAQATRNFNDFQMIMLILWKRLADTGRNWRHVYKGLTVFDYLVSHGADRVIDELRENVYQIQGLVDFQYVEPNGKDQGINVRKKAQSLVALLNDKEKIREVRQKAAANRDKYQGYSSTGGTFKPSSYSSTGGRGFNDWADDKQKEDRYGSAFSDDEHDDKKNADSDKSFKTDATYEDAPKKTEKKERSPPTKPSKASTTGQDEDDFDPRGSATARRAVEVDLISQLDFFSEPSSVDPFSSTAKTAPASIPTDLFASSGADDFGAFTSATNGSSIPGGNSDPFGQLADLQFGSKAAEKPLEFDSFSSGNTSFNAFSDIKTTQTVKTSFEAFSDVKTSQASSFEAFSDVKTSQTSSFEAFSDVKTSQTSTFDAFTDFQSSQTSFDAFSDTKASHHGSFDAFSDTKASHHGSFDAFSDMNASGAPFNAFSDIKVPPQPPAPANPVNPKPSFETKSSVWADSLASGFLDLNITAPKSTDTGTQPQSSGLGPDWFMDDKARAASGIGFGGPSSSSGFDFGFGGQPPPKTNAAFFSTSAAPKDEFAMFR